MSRPMLLLALIAAPACASDIQPDGDPDAAPGGKVITTPADDGSSTTRLDATAEDAWTALDLDSGAEAETGWDLAGQRFHLRLGDGLRVARLDGASFATVATAPEGGWLEDVAEDYAFERDGGWFDYDMATHVLTPKPIVWVVATTDDAYVKLAIESYYDDAGTAAVFTLRWQPLGAGQ